MMVDADLARLGQTAPAADVLRSAS